MSGSAHDESDLVWNIASNASGHWVVLAGALHQSDAVHIAERLAQLDRGEIILDLTQLSSMDTAGAHALAAVRDLRHRRGDRLIVQGANPQIEWMLCQRGIEVRVARSEGADRRDLQATGPEDVAAYPQEHSLTVSLVESESEHTVLRFTGILDQRSTDALRRWTQCILNTTTGLVIVDCAELAALDSPGVRLLGEFLVAMTSKERRVHLQHIHPMILQDLEREGALAEWTTELVRLDTDFQCQS